MMSSPGEPRIAIVHDELTRRGGAEVVLEELVRLFPHSDVFTLYAGEPRMVVDTQSYAVTTSFLQRFPLYFRRHPSRLLPLLPPAAESFDLSSYDLVLSSSSGFAKSIVSRVGIPHISYCHAPTRYLWDATHEVVNNFSFATSWPGRMVVHGLRLADFAAAQRVDSFIANSHYTAQRIAHYYRRESVVIPPPIDTAYFTPDSEGARGTFFLCTGRLTPVKHFEQAIHVCEKLGLPLVIIGVGSQMHYLRRIAGPYTRFVGRVSYLTLRRYYREARALLQPGIEDFGMASAEALSCGTPVIAVGQGGAREIVNDGVTGILYKDLREEALAEAIRQFLLREVSFRPDLLQQSVLKFSRRRFQDAIQKEVTSALV